MEITNIGSNDKKKRKFSHAAAVDHNHDDDEDDEEKKIDKFFALISRIREARDLLIDKYGAAGTGLEISENFNLVNNKIKKSKQIQNKEEHHLMPAPVEAWKPLFQLEDFMDEHLLHFKFPPTTFPIFSSPNVPPETDESAREGLDLRLSL